LFEGRAAIGYDHGYDAEVFYLGLALDPAYVEGFVEGCLERIGEEESDYEALFRDLWEDEGERETILTILQADCEILPGRPEDYLTYEPKAANFSSEALLKSKSLTLQTRDEEV
jgi:hypothetical protein